MVYINQFISSISKRTLLFVPLAQGNGFENIWNGSKYWKFRVAIISVLPFIVFLLAIKLAVG